MMKSFPRYIAILFIVLSSSYYLYLNRFKIKWSIGRWQSFARTENSDFPLRVTCKYKSLSPELTRLFMEPLQTDLEGNLIFWTKASGELESCELNKISIPFNSCDIGENKIICLNFQNIKVYLWKNETEFLSLVRFHKGLPRKLRDL